MPAVDFIANPRTFVQGSTQQISIANGQTQSSEATFGRQFSVFKIASVDATGIPTNASIELMVNGRVIYVNDTQILMLHPGEDFVWVVTVMAGADKISVRLGSVTTQAVALQITPYEESTL